MMKTLLEEWMFCIKSNQTGLKTLAAALMRIKDIISSSFLSCRTLRLYKMVTRVFPMEMMTKYWPWVRPTGSWESVSLSPGFAFPISTFAPENTFSMGLSICICLFAYPSVSGFVCFPVSVFLYIFVCGVTCSAMKWYPWANILLWW